MFPAALSPQQQLLFTKTSATAAEFTAATHRSVLLSSAETRRRSSNRRQAYVTLNAEVDISICMIENSWRTPQHVTGEIYLLLSRGNEADRTARRIYPRGMNLLSAQEVISTAKTLLNSYYSVRSKTMPLYFLIAIFYLRMSTHRPQYTQFSRQLRPVHAVVSTTERH